MTKGIRAPVPTLIRGVLYPSQSAAARALGVPQPNISAAMESGTLDRVGLGRNHGKRKPILLDGVLFPSQTALAAHLGKPRRDVNDWARRIRRHNRPVRTRFGIVSLPDSSAS